MSKSSGQPRLARRSWFSRLGTGMTALGAAFAAGAATPRAQSAGSGPWTPNRHAQDDWLDRIAGQHRFIFDTTTPDAFRSALRYANNYFVANQTAYGLKDADLAVVLVARHQSTSLAYNDAMWSKYGAVLSALINLTTETKQPPTTNLYASGPDAPLAALLERGVHLAVCQMATRVYAGGIARRMAGDADAIYNELASNLLPNSHLVPAGIVAVNRAQERGYACAFVG